VWPGARRPDRRTAVYSTNPLDPLDTLTTQSPAATLTWDADGNLKSDAVSA
jgi:hypothetical protein